MLFHKAHEKCSDILFTSLVRITLLKIVLSAITTRQILATILGSGDVLGIFGPGVAFAYGIGTIATVIGAARESRPIKLRSVVGGGVANKSSPSRVRNLLDSSHPIYWS